MSAFTPQAPIHVRSLATASLLMAVGTLYPPLMIDEAGHADHVLAGLLILAMSAGFVRGVGFVPQNAPARWLLSSWACGLAACCLLTLKLLR